MHHRAVGAVGVEVSVRLGRMHQVAVGIANRWEIWIHLSSSCWCGRGESE